MTFLQRWFGRRLAPAPTSSPPLPRLQRLVGHISAVCFRPAPYVRLEGEPRWLTATPELVERALALRDAPVALLVLEPDDRLLRVAPASEPADPEAGLEEVIAAWGTLLHRMPR